MRCGSSHYSPRTEATGLGKIRLHSIHSFIHSDLSKDRGHAAQESFASGAERSEALVKSSLDHSWSEEEYRVMLGALLVFPGNPALGNMLLDFDGDCQCRNCARVFPPLGYGILIVRANNA